MRRPREGAAPPRRRRHGIRHRLVVATSGLALAAAGVVGGAVASGAIGGAAASPVVSSASPTPASPVAPASPAVHGHPVGVPDGPVTSVAACPRDPAWSTPLPSGAVVSPPTLGHAGDGTFEHTEDGRTVTETAAGRCEYTVTVPRRSGR